jgi:hypothetical protein
MFPNRLVYALLLCASVNAFTVSRSTSKNPVNLSLSATKSKSTKEETKSKTSDKREPWDFLRFMKQSSKFVSLPKPPSKPSQIQPGDVIWSQSSSSFAWGPLDDVVMGGISSSTFDNSNGQWSGFVTDKNSGGFIGIRTTPFSKSLDMSTCNGIELTLKGVGSKQFKAVIRDSTEFNGVCWTGTFGGGSKWGLWSDKNDEKVTKVKIPFKTLIPAIFAKTVPDQVLKKDNIVGFQLVYSKASRLFSLELQDTSPQK